MSQPLQPLQQPQQAPRQQQQAIMQGANINVGQSQQGLGATPAQQDLRQVTIASSPGTLYEHYSNLEGKAGSLRRGPY